MKRTIFVLLLVLIAINSIIYCEQSNIRFTVDVTIYNAVSSQCDDTPNITADGSNIKNAKRWCAISRNLHNRYGGYFGFGDTIIIVCKNAEIRGEWVVRDLMNNRFKNKIDLLFRNKKLGLWNNITIIKKQ